MNEPLLEMTGIARHYVSGETVVKALDDVSLTFWPGEFVAIMGQSGSGKSTLMNLIGCLDRPTAGRYRVRGRDIAESDSDALAALRRETFGFVFQRYNLLGTATAEENVEIPAVYAGLPKAERMSRARALLSRIGLGERLQNRPSQLSGGQQQRVAIARALVNDPPIILADEPTGALDSKSGEEVMAWLKELHREGRTILVITHDRSVAEHAERIVLIQDGRIVGEERRDEKPPQDRPSMLSPPVPNQAESGHLFTSVAEAAKMAVRSLRVNLFRTALTLLGIIIGVAAVIVMLAIGSGSKQDVLDQIGRMGTNLVSIRPGAPGMRGGGDVVTLTPADAEAMREVPNVELVVPERNGRYPVRFGNTDYQTQVTGSGSDMILARDWPMGEGNFFSERDLAGYAPVAVIGRTVAEKLFPYDDPMGKMMLVHNVPFEVIGILSKKGASMFGGDQDDTIIIPVTTGLIRVFGQNYVNSVTVKVGDIARIEETQEAIRQLLLSRHRTEDFDIRNMASLLEMVNATQTTLTILLGSVAAISLLVGGIGVMNIMLVSVTERTREIGIRMATGARMRDILLQFNTEAAVVCTIGGLLGVALGFLAGWMLKLLGIKILFSVGPALLAFGCAFATGVLFGFIPARKAARLDPVVALSSE